MRAANTEEEDLGFLTATKPRAGIYPNMPLVRQHSFYLSGEILEPNEYTDWFHIIRTAGENDLIYIHINSPGGSIATAIQFMTVMEESPANIIASVEGECMSAATVIFLSAKAFQVNEHSLFMVHDYRSGKIGKGGELIDSITHERKWTEKLLKSIYKDFLTVEEFKNMFDGKDIWLTAEEVMTRLKVKVDKVQAEMEEEEIKEAKAAATKKRAVKKIPKDTQDLAPEKK